MPDPAAGTFEFPGGHLDDNETPRQAAMREWQEETGLQFPDGEFTGTWTSPNGIYQGFVYVVPHEADLDIFTRLPPGANPDDPDGDAIEVLAWMDPAQLAGNPAVRPELAASLGDVLAALGCPAASPSQGDESVCPCGVPVVYDELDGWQHGDGSISHDDGESVSDKMDAVAKAADAGPKAGSGDQSAPQAWPGWDYDLQAAAYWSPLLAAALLAALTPSALAAAWLKLGATSDASTKPDRIADVTAQAQDWLDGQGTAQPLEDAITGPVQGVLSDGFAIGARSAQAASEAAANGAQLGSIAADMGQWAPGASSVASELVGETGGAGRLADLLNQAGVTIKSIAASRISDLARVLAEGTENGDGAGDLAQAVASLLSDPSRAQMVAQTELARAANSAAMWAYRLHGVEQVTWVSADDDHVCAACDAEEARGPRPLGEGESPPLHPMCFPAGVKVSGPRSVAAMSRHYEGDLVTIVLASGNEIPVTPNHPVLTVAGWVAAGRLHEGDHLLRARDAGAVAAIVGPDDYQVEACIEDVARALAETGLVTAAAVPVAAEDFHGDGTPGHDVHVIAAHRHAVGDGDAEHGKSAPQVKLKARKMPAGLGSGNRHPLGFRGDPATAGLMGRTDHSAAGAAVGLLPAQPHRVTAPAHADTVVGQHALHGPAADAVLGGQGLDGFAGEEADNHAGRGLKSPPVLEDASLADLAVEDGEADSGEGRALADALAELVEADRVVELRRVGWSGHVYNLETVNGWYFANGIIAHNCRCALIPI